MVRKLVEYLGRDVSYRRSLPIEFGGGELYVSPDAALQYLKLGSYAFDSELLKIPREFAREGSVVWDVGANVGSFALVSAKYVGSSGYVLCIEADTWLVGLIRKSIKLKKNANLQIDVLPAAAADKPGIAEFMIAARGRASNALKVTGARTQAGGVRERQLVPTIMLDQLLDISRPPDLIKIDVEGAEVAVLLGAKKILSDVRPIFYCEVGPSQNDEVTAMFREASYVLLDPSKPSGERIPLSRCPFNALACPEYAFVKLNTK